jgi:CBS domain-containing protein
MGATVRDVMTTSVITVRGDTPFKELAAVLARSRVSGFPVVDQAGKVIGVVPETDLVIKEADQAGHPGSFAGLRRSRDREKAAGVTAAQVMTSPPVTIGPDEPVQHAAFLMYDRAVSRLPVVDEAGHLVGIVSQPVARARAASGVPRGNGGPGQAADAPPGDGRPWGGS